MDGPTLSTRGRSRRSVAGLAIAGDSQRLRRVREQVDQRLGLARAEPRDDPPLRRDDLRNDVVDYADSPLRALHRRGIKVGTLALPLRKDQIHRIGPGVDIVVMRAGAHSSMRLCPGGAPLRPALSSVRWHRFCFLLTSRRSETYHHFVR